MPSRHPRSPTKLPEGFVYHPGFLTEHEEQELLEPIRTLSFENFDFHGYMAKRRIVQYGMEYSSSTRKAVPTHGLPDDLLPYRDRAAHLAGIPPESLVECIVTEYPPGAPIGWHRDAPQFEIVIGISLSSSCRMRFKPWKKEQGEGEREREKKPASLILEPRSLYVISGPSRWQWQHSIPPVEEKRYSITFRTLREKIPSSLGK